MTKLTLLRTVFCILKPKIGPAVPPVGTAATAFIPEGLSFTNEGDLDTTEGSLGFSIFIDGIIEGNVMSDRLGTRDLELCTGELGGEGEFSSEELDVLLS